MSDTPALRLDPADEYTHDNTGESNFNESMYFNFFDAVERLGGFLRIGNRPNEGYAETTVCVFRPDGSALFNFKRRPFERLHIGYAGKACSLKDPLAMRDPSRAFQSNPFAAVRIDLTIEGVGPMFGGERRGAPPAKGEMEFARGHYEQHHRASGTVEIEGHEVAFDGLGLRDHSWGPRSWQAPRYYRWLTGNFDADRGFMASWIATPDGQIWKGGFVYRGQDVARVRSLELDTDWSSGADNERYHDRIHARLLCDDGNELEIEGRVLSLIPLRNRRVGKTTRISEGLTEWTWEGRTGYGLSEYLDQK
jgi:hypothetical protein